MANKKFKRISMEAGESGIVAMYENYVRIGSTGPSGLSFGPVVTSEVQIPLFSDRRSQDVSTPR
jgi:hypothetical protein